MIDLAWSRPSRAGHVAGSSADNPRHGAEPGRLLPGPRGLQSVLLPACPGIVQKTMDKFARLFGRAVSFVRLRRRARRRPGDRHHGLRRGVVEETVENLNAAGTEGGLVIVRSTARSTPRPWSRAIPKSAKIIAVLDRTKEPGGSRRAALPGRHHRAGRMLGGIGRRPACPRSSAGVTACRPRSSPRPWWPASSRRCASRSPSGTSPSASSTTSRT
jgi:hypothetical protein